jgi:putative ABC transport system ATP-binding protein
MSEPVMDARGVVKFLGEGAAKVQALKGVDLTLHSGELALLMGPSGSGKTTLLSVLGCILSPSEGVVRVCGKPTTNLGPEQLAKLRREHIGFVFQSYHLFPTLTALDNVRLALDVRGEHSGKAVKRSKDALARVGLAHKIYGYPRELSGAVFDHGDAVGGRQGSCAWRARGHARSAHLAVCEPDHPHRRRKYRG